MSISVFFNSISIFPIQFIWSLWRAKWACHIRFTLWFWSGLENISVNPTDLSMTLQLVLAVWRFSLSIQSDISIFVTNLKFTFDFVWQIWVCQTNCRDHKDFEFVSQISWHRSTTSSARSLDSWQLSRRANRGNKAEDFAAFVVKISRIVVK